MVSAADYIRNLVESKPPGHHGNVIEVIAVKLDSLTSSILGSERMAREAMSELLKAAFNLLLHYPRVC
jgi:RNA binding exosome subunit